MLHIGMNWYGLECVMSQAEAAGMAAGEHDKCSE